MARIFLVHWNESELRDLAAPLTAVGHDVHSHFAPTKPPRWDGFEVDVAVISLERLPSHGREVADWIWSTKKRRHVPVVFVGGRADKVAETKTRFPDAVYSSIEELRRVVDGIVAGRMGSAPVPEIRVKTAETAKQPSATPLAKKLGIVAGIRFALVDPPRKFSATLTAPNDAIQTKAATSECDVVVLFARDSRDLEAGLKAQRKLLKPTASLWLAWPKRTSLLAGDLSDEIVRQMGLRSGLVDVKVCAIDDNWSGLKFMVRIADRPKEPEKRAAKK